MEVWYDPFEMYIITMTQACAISFLKICPGFCRVRLINGALNKRCDEFPVLDLIQR
jgi:hypothetical protein